jgi:hypothetical protein
MTTDHDNLLGMLDQRWSELTNLKSVELLYLDNKLQQVASLWEESQLFVLCSFTKFALWRKNLIFFYMASYR